MYIYNNHNNNHHPFVLCVCALFCYIIMDSNPPTGNVPQQDQPPPLQLPVSLDSSSSSRPLRSPGGSSSSSLSPATQHASRRHATFRGIRSRSGKWVSEIREPRKTTRIWLGTYPTPEMAAAAYDVAALALKGPDTPLNFPNFILSYPIPASLSANDIRAAAAAAAEARLERPAESTGQNLAAEGSGSRAENVEGGGSVEKSEEFIDEDELLNMPNLLDDMARGMQVSPPRLKSPSSDDSPGNSDGDSLWSF